MNSCQWVVNGFPALMVWDRLRYHPAGRQPNNYSLGILPPQHTILDDYKALNLQPPIRDSIV